MDTRSWLDRIGVLSPEVANGITNDSNVTLPDARFDGRCRDSFAKVEGEAKHLATDFSRHVSESGESIASTDPERRTSVDFGVRYWPVERFPYVVFYDLTRIGSACTWCDAHVARLQEMAFTSTIESAKSGKGHRRR